MPAATVREVARSTRIKFPSSREELYGAMNSGVSVAISTAPISFMEKVSAESSAPVTTSSLFLTFVMMAGVWVWPLMSMYERL